jgi:hypothetical protein
LKQAREARQERRDAEMQLAQTRSRTPEVDEITARLERLYDQNNFGHKIELAMARKRAQ